MSRRTQGTPGSADASLGSPPGPATAAEEADACRAGLPGMRVVGGAGGTTAALDDLDRAAGVLRSAAEDVGAAAAGCLRLVIALSTGIRRSEPLGPHVPGVPGHDAILAELEADRARWAVVDAVRSAARAVGAEAERIAWLAQGIERSRQGYAGAEEDVGRRWTGLRDALAWPAGVGAGLRAGWWLRERIVHAAGGTEVELLARTVAGLDARLAGRSRWTARALAPPAGAQAPPPDGPADVLHAVADLAADAPPGTLGIQRLDRVDGSRSWIVLIPGTQSWRWRGRRTPLDLGSNVALAGGALSDSARAVLAAMDAAGIGPEEEVLLAGHSQGGMAAMALAASAAVAARHRITAVATAGSPVAHLDVRRGTSVLSVEHAGDVVPRLDARSTRDRPEHVTVVRDRRSGAPERRTGPGALASFAAPALLPVRPGVPGTLDPRAALAEHGVRGYAETLELVEDVRDPSLMRWRRDAGAFLDGRVRDRTTTYYAVERLPPGAAPDDGTPDPAAVRGGTRRAGGLSGGGRR